MMLVDQNKNRRNISWKHHVAIHEEGYVDGLVQDCSNSIANALELLQSCTKSSMYCLSKTWKRLGMKHL